MDAIRFTQTAVTKLRPVGTFTVALMLLVASFALSPMQALATSQTRAENIAAILKLVDVQTLIQKSQIESYQVARTRMNDVRAQLSGYMSSMNPEQKQKFDAAIEKYITTVYTSYDSADAAAAWGRLFAVNFTDRELSQAVELSRTPLGGKLLKASITAASQWNTEIRQAHFRIADSAYTQLLTEVKALLNEIVQGQTPSAK
jgi:hypothetical protein